MNYYEILEVSPNASQEVIRAAYKSLMQRYHPDKNPDNAENAKRALLVGRAYEVLSNPTSRVAYDSELNQQLPNKLSTVEGTDHSIKRSAVDNNARGAKSISMIFGLLSITFIIVVVMGIIQSHVSDNADKLALESQTSLENQYNSEMKLSVKVSEYDKAGTIPIVIENLKVLLKANQSDLNNHYLSIPVLGVVVGNVEQGKVMQYINRNKTIIRKNLVNQLAMSDIHELQRIDGEKYLSNIIAESINNTIGTTGIQFTEYKGDFRGIKQILLPESFSVH